MNPRAFFASLLLAASVFLIAAPGGALAAEIRNGPNDVTIGSGETVDDDLFAGGQTVTIAGHVTGDAYAAGQSVLVTGTIDGDLIAASQQVIVDGTVNGNIRAAGETVTVNGTVGRNVTALAQHANVSSNARLGGSLTSLSATLNQLGSVGRGATVAGDSLQLAGAVGGNVLARANTLSVAPSAHIAGNLDYRADRETTLPSGAVAGTVHFERIPQRQPEPESVLNGMFEVTGLVFLVGCFLIGALTIMFAPRSAARAIELGRQQPLPSFGLGLLVLVTAPIAVVLIGITLVGLPVAVVLACLYALVMLLAWPAVGLAVGTEIGRWLRRDRPLPILGSLAVGLIVLHLVTHIPFFGGLITLLGLIYGLGVVIQSVRRWRRPNGAQPASPAVTVAVPA
jgi:cytoskeletal protein CcmA (bactofilin family)